MIIDGKKIALDIQAEIKAEIQKITGRPPCLAVILVGEHAPSQIYIQRKTQACEAVGMRSIKKHLPDAITEKALIEEVRSLNHNPEVDGILVQLPLPAHINPTSIINCIDPEKDIDGFHPFNVGKMLIGDTDGFFPCTPYGVKTLLERMSIDISGRHVVVIGRSNIVGKPMAALLMQPTPGGNATVTVAHRLTLNLKQLCLSAQVIIAAIGQPLFLKADMIPDGAVVIDVGINKIPDASKRSGYRIVGDVDFDNVAPKCSYITPVPGGVGPMTIAMLLKNTLFSYQKRVGTLNTHA